MHIIPKTLSSRIDHFANSYRSSLWFIDNLVCFHFVAGFDSDIPLIFYPVGLVHYVPQSFGIFVESGKVYLIPKICGESVPSKCTYEENLFLTL